jgi:hypothetical protein
VLTILAFIFAEDRVRPWLNELHDWLAQHNAACMAVLLSIIGATMLGKGFAALWQ